MNVSHFLAGTLLLLGGACQTTDVLGCDGVCGNSLVCDRLSGKCVTPESLADAGAPHVRTGLPCDVAAVMAEHCDRCHGATLAQGAPVHLVSRADFTATGASGATMGQRSVVRMRQTTSVMPPAPSAPVPEAQVALVEAWVTAGMPATTCTVDIDAGTGAPTDAGSVVVEPYDGGIAGLPCDVAAMVANRCASCHRTPPTGGATFALLSRSDFLAPSSVGGENLGQRGSARLHDTQSPMPPYGTPAATAAEVALFDAWVSAGLPAGSCESADAGMTGPAPTTCASGVFWSNGNHGDKDMNPGLACKACHQSKSPTRAYPFAGTVFPALHEKDLCDSRVPAGVSVQIIDKNGKVALTYSPSSTSGNFHSSIFSSVALPYTAKIVANGKTATMTTPQTNGDCNSCHTEQGANGAPGRLVWPQ